MNNNLKNLFLSINKDNGRMLNDLIEIDVIKLKDAVKEADAECIYNIARSVNGDIVEILLNQLVEMQSFEYVGEMLLMVKNNQKIENMTSLEIYAINHIDMLLDTMSNCTDLTLLRRICSNSEVPFIINFLNNLIDKLEVRNDLASLDEKDQLLYLTNLYYEGDFAAIIENRDIFSKLFNDEEEITRK